MDWLLAILFCFVIFCLFSLFMFVRAVNEDLKEYEYYGFEDVEEDEWAVYRYPRWIEPIGLQAV